MVSAGMVQRRSIAAVAGSYGDEDAVDGECGDGAGKEHCRGCILDFNLWRLSNRSSS
jgi:hypothetical protein